MSRVVLLSGGVGGAKLAEGLATVMDPAALTVIANTGDDIELFGLHISPDLDTLTYTLADCVNRENGWGRADETWAALETLRQLGGTDWFRLGDRDLGLHLYRTERLRAGAGLAAISGEIARGFGLKCTVLPMCESPVPTLIGTAEGEMHLQEYLVRRRCEPVVRSVRSVNIESAQPAPGVAEAIAQADAILIAPSNPFISIGPILAVPGMLDLLKGSPAPKIAVSPIIGGRALKGPAAKMLAELGHPVSAAGVAGFYRDWVDWFAIDPEDAALQGPIEALGVRVKVIHSVMHDLDSKARLARDLLELGEQDA